MIATPLWWLLVADRPSQASWVSREEREYIETSLARENAGAPPSAGYRAGYRDALRGSVVWRLVLVYFFIQVGLYGLTHLMKTMIGGSYLIVGAITAIPYLFAIAGLWVCVSLVIKETYRALCADPPVSPQ